MKKQVSAKATQEVIALGQSKRLAAMRQSVMQQAEKPSIQNKLKHKLDKKENQALRAREVIERSISDIKATYPQGMQNKLFALRYGDTEKLQQMSLRQLFSLFKLQEALPAEVAELKFKE